MSIAGNTYYLFSHNEPFKIYEYLPIYQQRQGLRCISIQDESPSMLKPHLFHVIKELFKSRCFEFLNLLRDRIFKSLKFFVLLEECLVVVQTSIFQMRTSLFYIESSIFITFGRYLYIKNIDRLV